MLRIKCIAGLVAYLFTLLILQLFGLENSLLTLAIPLFPAYFFGTVPFSIWLNQLVKKRVHHQKKYSFFLYLIGIGVIPGFIMSFYLEQSLSINGYSLAIMLTAPIFWLTEQGLLLFWKKEQLASSPSRQAYFATLLLFWLLSTYLLIVNCITEGYLSSVGLWWDLCFFVLPILCLSTPLAMLLISLTEKASIIQQIGAQALHIIIIATISSVYNARLERLPLHQPYHWGIYLTWTCLFWIVYNSMIRCNKKIRAKVSL